MNISYCEGRTQAAVRVRIIARPDGNSPESEDAFDGSKP
jgi:hypothetical protein